MEKILVEISARHIHLCQEHLDILFGKDYQLTKKKELSQPGQYAAEEKVIVRGPKSELKVTVLGPLRKHTQLEISLTEARTLGVKALIRESGNIAGTTGIEIIGPNGSVTIEEGVIAAKRHIHMTPEDAKNYGVENGDLVSVKIETEDRSLTFSDTVIRVSDKFALAMHIDTDEANAAGFSGTTMGVLIK